MTATEERRLRRALHGTLQSMPPSPAPLEAIIRRSRGIRLRRAGAAVGALGLAGIIAGASLALRADPQPTVPVAAPPITAGPGGVFAHGTADGHPWRLAVQDIADPGYTCLPAIVLNGTDADPVYPDPLSSGAVALGPAVPGVAFAFIQLPARSNGIVVDGQHVPAVTVAACGYRYHVAGFAYPLTKVLRITGLASVLTLPSFSTQAPAKFTSAQTAGLWVNPGSVRGETAPGTLAWGTLADGRDWVITLQFGTGGDCYEFEARSSLGSTQMGYCGPVSTPDGPETIMALPLGSPDSGTGATGYAVPVGPDIDQLTATLSDGSSQPAAFCVVDGRKYAAFIVPTPLRLAKLTWFDAQGQAIASTTALPRYGYTQFQP